MISTSVVSTWFTPTILFCFLNFMMAVIFLTSRRKQSDKHPQMGVDSTQLLRAPSLLQRVKSINFSINHRLDHYSYAASSVDSPNVDGRNQITRSKSETVVETPAPVKIMKTSVSEKDLASRDERTTVRERKGKSVATTGRSSEDEGVDEKADDFINRFRQQLKLQRLDSILRYKEMLNRGADPDIFQEANYYIPKTRQTQKAQRRKKKATTLICPTRNRPDQGSYGLANEALEYGSPRQGPIDSSNHKPTRGLRLFLARPTQQDTKLRGSPRPAR